MQPTDIKTYLLRSLHYRQEVSMAAVMQPSSCWGRLLIPGMDGAEDLVYSIEKPVTVIGR